MLNYLYSFYFLPQLAVVSFNRTYLSGVSADQWQHRGVDEEQLGIDEEQAEDGRGAHDRQIQIT